MQQRKVLSQNAIGDPVHSDYLLTNQEVIKKQEPHVTDETQSNEIEAGPLLFATQLQNQFKQEQARKHEQIPPQRCFPSRKTPGMTESRCGR